MHKEEMDLQARVKSLRKIGMKPKTGMQQKMALSSTLYWQEQDARVKKIAKVGGAQSEVWPIPRA